MSAHPPFDPGTVEAIAKVLDEAGSGTDINHLIFRPGWTSIAWVSSSSGICQGPGGVPEQFVCTGAHRGSRDLQEILPIKG
jgi:hypothetical protein